MSQILVAILCLWASLASADWTGLWSGPASYENNFGDTLKYKKIGITVKETTSDVTYSLAIDNWSRVLSFQKSGIYLLLDRKIVGYLTEQDLVIKEIPLIEFGWDMIHSFSLHKNEDKTLQFKDKTFWDYTKKEWDTTAGLLTPQSPRIQ